MELTQKFLLHEHPCGRTLQRLTQLSELYETVKFYCVLIKCFVFEIVNFTKGVVRCWYFRILLLKTPPHWYATIFRRPQLDLCMH